MGDGGRAKVSHAAPQSEQVGRLLQSGPMIEAVCQAREFQAMARGKSARGTSIGPSAVFAGAKKARKAPNRKPTINSRGTEAQPCQVSQYGGAGDEKRRQGTGEQGGFAARRRSQGCGGQHEGAAPAGEH